MHFGICSRNDLLQKVFFIIFRRFEVALRPERGWCFEAPVCAGVFMSVKVKDQIVLVRISWRIETFVTGLNFGKALMRGDLPKWIFFEVHFRRVIVL